MFLQWWTWGLKRISECICVHLGNQEKWSSGRLGEMSLFQLRKKNRGSASLIYSSNCFQSKVLEWVCGMSDFIVILPFCFNIFHYSISKDSLKSTTENKLLNFFFHSVFFSVLKHHTLQKCKYFCLALDAE